MTLRSAQLRAPATLRPRSALRFRSATLARAPRPQAPPCSRCSPCSATGRLLCALIVQSARSGIKQKISIFCIIRSAMLRERNKIYFLYNVSRFSSALMSLYFRPQAPPCSRCSPCSAPGLVHSGIIEIKKAPLRVLFHCQWFYIIS